MTKGVVLMVLSSWKCSTHVWLSIQANQISDIKSDIKLVVHM